MGGLAALGGIGAGITMGMGEIRRQNAEKIVQAREEREAEDFKNRQEDRKLVTAARKRAADVQATEDDAYSQLGQDQYAADPAKALPSDQAGPPVLNKTGDKVGLADVKRNTSERLASKGYAKESAQAYQEYQQYKAEGVDKAVAAFKRGAGTDELTKIFNDHGEHKIKGIDAIDYKTGEIKYRDHTGQAQTMNALEVERRMLSLKDQTSIKKDEAGAREHAAKADETEAEIKAGLPGAKVSAQKANAAQSYASANSSNATASKTKYELDQDKLADVANATPAEQRTPQQKAALERRGSKNESQDPADVKSVKWLMANIPALNGDAKAAWEMHHSAKATNPQEALIDIKAKLIAADKMGDYKGPEGIKQLNADAAAILQTGAPQAPGLADAAPQQPTGPRKRSLDSFAK